MNSLSNIRYLPGQFTRCGPGSYRIGFSNGSLSALVNPHHAVLSRLAHSALSLSDHIDRRSQFKHNDSRSNAYSEFVNLSQAIKQQKVNDSKNVPQSTLLDPDLNRPTTLFTKIIFGCLALLGSSIIGGVGFTWNEIKEVRKELKEDIKVLGKNWGRGVKENR